MAKHKVAGTGHNNRADGIRKWCNVGDTITLKREPHNEFDDNAIAVYIKPRRLLGLIKIKHQIGYINADAAEKMAFKLDMGADYQASISRVYCPEHMDWPKVTVDVVFSKLDIKV